MNNKTFDALFVPTSCTYQKNCAIKNKKVKALEKDNTALKDALKEVKEECTRLKVKNEMLKEALREAVELVKNVERKGLCRVSQCDKEIGEACEECAHYLPTKDLIKKAEGLL